MKLLVLSFVFLSISAFGAKVSNYGTESAPKYQIQCEKIIKVCYPHYSEPTASDIEKCCGSKEGRSLKITGSLNRDSKIDTATIKSAPKARTNKIENSARALD
jgi:hypothetical protein